MQIIEQEAPKWRTVLTWMSAIIESHTKLSWNKTKTNGYIPADNVNSVLQDMAKAADAAVELQRENEQLKKQNEQFKKQFVHVFRGFLYILNMPDDGDHVSFVVWFDGYLNDGSKAPETVRKLYASDKTFHLNKFTECVEYITDLVKDNCDYSLRIESWSENTESAEYIVLKYFKNN